MEETTGKGAVKSGEAEIAYRVVGEGSPVVLLPGLGSPGQAWGRVIELVAQTHQTVVIDPRGSGASRTPG